jgi:hypothetical protein
MISQELRAMKALAKSMSVETRVVAPEEQVPEA